MADVVLGNRGRRGLRSEVRNRRQVRRDGSPVSGHRLAVSSIPLCLFKFRFALVSLLVFIWTPGLTVEVREQDLAGGQAALMKNKASVLVVTDKSKVQWTIKTTSSHEEDSTVWSEAQ